MENNNTFSISEINPGWVAQQPYGNRKEGMFSEGVGIFGKYECRHQKSYKMVCHKLGISANTATWQEI